MGAIWAEQSCNPGKKSPAIFTKASQPRIASSGNLPFQFGGDVGACAAKCLLSLRRSTDGLCSPPRFAANSELSSGQPRNEPHLDRRELAKEK